MRDADTPAPLERGTRKGSRRPDGAALSRGPAALVWPCLALLASPVALAQPQGDTALPVVREWVLAGQDLRAGQDPPPTHRMRLEMALVSGTRWAPQAILDAVRGAAKILAGCGVRVSAARLQEFDGPPRYRYFRTPVAREFAVRARLPKPAVFFVDETLQQPAFDAEAIGRSNSRTRPELADTVWVAAGTRDLPVALAHELVHVLSDSGEHSTVTGNLMREQTDPESTNLTADQCARLLEVGEANRLLERSHPGQATSEAVPN